jgi:hypothetical protein
VERVVFLGLPHAAEKYTGATLAVAGGAAPKRLQAFPGAPETALDAEHAKGLVVRAGGAPLVKEWVMTLEVGGKPATAR